MLERFGSFIVKYRWWVIAIWIIAAALVITLLPKLSSVESNNQSSFLPSTYESVQASKVAEKSFPIAESATDILVFKSKTGQALTADEQKGITAAVNTINAKHIAKVKAVVTGPQQLSPSKTVQLAQVIYAGQSQDMSLGDSVSTLRNTASSAITNTDLTVGLTGEVAIGHDTQSSFDKALKIVSIATILLVLILPAIVFKSPFIGLLPVLSVGLVYSMGSSLLAEAAKLFNFHVSQQLSVLFTVVLFGVGTDYVLFLLFRYRERLRSGDNSREAVGFALARAGEAIFSAALVVISSFVAMFFAKFGIFSTFAPGLVIMVSLMLIAALTLIPALVAVIQQKVFWPSKPRTDDSMKPTISKKLGGIVARRPGRVTAAILIVLLALSIGAFSYKPDFSSFSQPPAHTESATAFSEIQKAFPAGVLNPTQVYATSYVPLQANELASLRANLTKASGVASVLPAQISTDGKSAVFSVILKDSPSSPAAIKTVSGPLQTAAKSSPVYAKVLVGGVTASLADVQSVTSRDLKVIFPIAAAFIFIILVLLLRSIVAPIFLVLSVSLVFAATLGAAVFVFTKIGNAAGLIFFLPIMLYVFVVAIGTDYNILTIVRLREEVRAGNPPRKAADLTIEHSSATVASAGLILAGTFLSLMFAHISLLSQMGFSIAIGVAIAAYLVAPLLVPSLSALLGYSIWWPGHRPSKAAKKSAEKIANS
jgi:RND superfamily putative drug exporter